MAEIGSASLDVIKENLQSQIDSSQQLLEIVEKLADAAKDDKNSSVSPSIAPALQKLVTISKGLSESATGAAQAMVNSLSQK